MQSTKKQPAAFWQVGFFSTRPIKANEELTYNYGPDYVSSKKFERFNRPCSCAFLGRSMGRGQWELDVHFLKANQGGNRGLG
eukprot:SAG31_NODE_6182_length_2134_cov_1.482064_1_plen_82_part_00